MCTDDALLVVCVFELCLHMCTTISQLHITHSPHPHTHTQQLPVTNEAHQNVTDGLVEVRGQGEIEYTDRLLENGHFTSPPVQQEESILSGESTCNCIYNVCSAGGTVRKTNS